MSYTVAAFYRFVTLADPSTLRDDLCSLFAADRLCGTLLIAGEGVNGTLAGSAQTIDRLLTVLSDRVGLDRAGVKFSRADRAPFGRLKFKLKREILTFNEPGLDPARPGHYVPPADWNALIADPDILLLDTRNRYEIDLGTFAGAIDPGIETFSQFARYVRETLDPGRHRKVAMFCTGGIRCEKASAFMRREGFAEVYHLKGGILKYLEEVPREESRWHGECFVFDERGSLGHGILQRCDVFD